MMMMMMMMVMIMMMMHSTHDVGVGMGVGKGGTGASGVDDDVGDALRVERYPEAPAAPDDGRTRAPMGGSR